MTEPTPTPDHLAVAHTDRGFAHLPAIAVDRGGSVRVYESSSAEGPAMWLQATEPSYGFEGSGRVDKVTLHVPVEAAVQLAEQILFLAQGHYQGPLNIALPPVAAQRAPRLLRDAETSDTIGPATPEQIAASDSDGTGGGIILIDGDGDVIGSQDEHQPGTVQPVRRVYVEG